MRLRHEEQAAFYLMLRTFYGSVSGVDHRMHLFRYRTALVNSPRDQTGVAMPELEASVW